jgi:hypothetical protein
MNAACSDSIRGYCCCLEIELALWIVHSGNSAEAHQLQRWVADVGFQALQRQFADRLRQRPTRQSDVQIYSRHERARVRRSRAEHRSSNFQL